MAKTKEAEKKTAPRGRGRPPVEDGLTAKIALRALPEDDEQLSAVAKSLGFKVPDVARAALRLGLTLLEQDATFYLVGATTASKRTAALKKRISDDG